MNLQLITNEMVTAEFGDRHDGICVYKGNKNVGFLTDLRVTLGRKSSKKLKQKAYSTKLTEERREAMPGAVESMVEFLSNNLPGAEVFINISQPNVHIDRSKFYIICDPLTDKFNRLGIMHQTLTSEEISEMIDNSHKLQSESARHVLVNGLSRDDIVEIIKKLCK
ncbi:inhibitor of host transcription [Pectobacterium bacteriophage PM2]|uniref:Inhibitor of host transcription n=1 Tax=Pectobacterium bacteriophage PM2 TaxID=1429794 RepID=A0A0A0Q3L6_9CAUD|nr:inhibitor of host transcription [Pectobacterium bacteriophage PM2]AHY25207.1 inhibitor of host transcription [Pectobacterium bacteriophage PM2]